MIIWQRQRSTGLKGWQVLDQRLEPLGGVGRDSGDPQGFLRWTHPLQLPGRMNWETARPCAESARPVPPHAAQRLRGWGSLSSRGCDLPDKETSGSLQSPTFQAGEHLSCLGKGLLQRRG